MFGRLLESLGRLWLEERPSRERGDRFWLGAMVVNLTGLGRSSRDFEWSSGGPRTLLRVSERNLERESADRTLAGIAAGTVARVVLGVIPLMEGGDEPGIIEEWKRLGSSEPDSRRRDDYGALAIVFAEAANRRDLWKSALKEWNVTRSKQVDEWRAEGEVRGKASAAIAVLEARFQTVPADLASAIQAVADPDRLSRMVSLAATAASLDQFRADSGL
jgi:hypothetical protein